MVASLPKHHFSPGNQSFTALLSFALYFIRKRTRLTVCKYFLRISFNILQTYNIGEVLITTLLLSKLSHFHLMSRIFKPSASLKIVTLHMNMYKQTQSPNRQTKIFVAERFKKFPDFWKLAINSPIWPRHVRRKPANCSSTPRPFFRHLGLLILRIFQDCIHSCPRLRVFFEGGENVLSNSLLKKFT